MMCVQSLIQTAHSVSFHLQKSCVCAQLLSCVQLFVTPCLPGISVHGILDVLKETELIYSRKKKIKTMVTFWEKSWILH